MEAVIEAEVLGVRLRRRTLQSAIDELRGLLADGRPHSVYFVHAATANLAFEDSGYREALNRGHLVLNDGIGVKWAAQWRGLALDENLVGTDLVPRLLAEPTSRFWRVYLLGGRPGIGGKAAAALSRRYSTLEIAGFTHGHFSLEEEPAVVSEIRNSKADLVLVGMGNPRQELFIDRRLNELGCRAAIGVGGLLDHLAGDLHRAPFWVRRLRLEWCQLLIQQPHKWRRYLLGIPKFLWRAARPWPGARLRRLVRCSAKVQCSSKEAPLPAAAHLGTTAPDRCARETSRAVLGLASSSLSLLLGLGMALTAGEALVRLTRPQILERYPEGLYISSTTRQYKLRPGFRGVFRYPEFQTEVSISEQGLREDRLYAPLHPGNRRILAVGDSFTMAYSVEQPRTWVRVLERLLNASGAGERWEVINAGVPGYSTWQELAYLEEEGLALRPDVILLGFFIGNDITDNERPSLPVELRGGRLISAGFRDGLLPFALRLFLAGHSHLYHLAHNAGTQSMERRLRYAGDAEEGWRQTERLIGRFSLMCRERAIRGIVMLMPESAQVEPGATKLLAARMGAALDAARPNRRMRGICAHAGLEVIDLLDVVVGRSGLYFPQDGHWTEPGNSAAAWALFDYLRHDAF